MSLEEELPHLFEELAANHVVDERPTFEPASVERSARGRGSARPTRFTIAAVAACAVVLIGGLVVIGSFNDAEAPTATSAPAPESSQPSPPESSSPAVDVAASPPLGLIRIEARSGSAGTTGVVVVFDGDLPKGDAVPVDVAASPPPDQLAYATQYSLSTPVSVCGDTHWFPSPGNPIVDLYVPAEWFDPGALIDPPTTWAPDSGPPAKIIVCEPLNGTVQISIWGSASARMEDVGVSVDEGAITIDIAPDPTGRPAENADTGAPIGPLVKPLVLITGEGEAAYLPDGGVVPVLIYRDRELTAGPQQLMSTVASISSSIWSPWGPPG